MPRGTGHAWRPPAPAPAELRELLAGHTSIEVRRCGECRLTAAWSPTWNSGRQVLRALLGPDGWARGARLGACPGFPEPPVVVPVLGIIRPT